MIKQIGEHVTESLTGQKAERLRLILTRGACRPVIRNSHERVLGTFHGQRDPEDIPGGGSFDDNLVAGVGRGNDFLIEQK